MFFCLKNQFWVIKIVKSKEKPQNVFFRKIFTRKHLVGMDELSLRNQIILDNKL